jgi:hypothetical protein
MPAPGFPATLADFVRRTAADVTRSSPILATLRWSTP